MYNLIIMIRISIYKINELFYYFHYNYLEAMMYVMVNPIYQILNVLQYCYE
jgi:hypothetical protein